MPISYPAYGDGGSSAFFYTPQGPTSQTWGGITAGFDLGTTPISGQDLIDQAIYSYVPPSISLAASPVGGYYEFGNHRSPVNLSATTTRRRLPITSVVFERSVNGAAFSNIFTVPTPAANGGVELYSDSPSVPPAVSQVASIRWRSIVGDGTATNTSNIVSHSYVYPIYFGVGAAGLSDAAVGALTKIIGPQASYTRSFSPSSQKCYFAVPGSYPPLSSVIDQNGYNVTADWTSLTRSGTITGLDTTAQPYTIYEFLNPATVSNFSYTFNF